WALLRLDVGDRERQLDVDLVGGPVEAADGEDVGVHLLLEAEEIEAYRARVGRDPEDERRRVAISQVLAIDGVEGMPGVAGGQRDAPPADRLGALGKDWPEAFAGGTEDAERGVELVREPDTGRLGEGADLVRERAEDSLA